MSRRVVEPHAILLLAVPRLALGPSRPRIVVVVGLPLLGHGLGEVLVKARGAGREVDLRVNANNLPATNVFSNFKDILSGGGAGDFICEWLSGFLFNIC